MKTKGSRNKKGVSRVLNVHGYYEVFQPEHPLAKKNGYVREHRMIAWDVGLLKDKKQIVHHLNEDKTDNRPENLSIASNAEHTRLHWEGAKRAEWTPERRAAKSEAMRGNKNAIGNIYENPELIKPV